jgi:uncharacterized protein
MWNGDVVVDADSHILEPPDLWLSYVDPRFRENCLHVERNPQIGDQLVVHGQRSALIPRLGGVPWQPDQPVRDWNTLQPTSGGYASYQESVTPDAWDAVERLAWMDRHGIDVSFVFPSLGLIWPREVDTGTPYARAHFAAYNRWIQDFASVDRHRLVPVAQLAHADGGVDKEQVRVLANDGFQDVMLPVGTSLTDELDSFFGATQDCGMRVHLHKVAIPHNLPCTSPTSLAVPGADPFVNHVHETLPGQTLLTALIGSGVCDRFPDVRFCWHECNVGWLPSWLDRATESWEITRGRSRMRQPPAHYLLERDTLFFSVGLGESVSRMPADLDARLLLATDHPHPGAPESPQREWETALADVQPEPRRALLGGNAVRMARL